MLENRCFPRPRQRLPAARLLSGVVAAALLISVGGCLDDSLAPSSGTEVRIDAHRVVAQVNQGEQATVVIDVSYYTDSEATIPLPVTPSRIAIDAGATVTQPIVVTLDPCLADPAAYHGGSEGGEGEAGCFLEVTFTLLDDAESEISSATTFVNFPVTPGETVELESIVLSNVWSLEVAPIDTLGPEHSVTSVATAYTKAGVVVPNASFIWTSYNTNVAVIDSLTGVLTATGPGEAYIEARSGDVYNGTLVEVTDGGSFDVGTPGGICVSLDGRTICPGESGAPTGSGRRRK